MAKKKIENEAFIDEEFNDRIDWIVDDDVLLHDETYKEWEHNQSEEMRRDLSELRRIVLNFTKKDFAAVVITAMENYPFMVLQIVAERIMRLQEGEK
jgi:hypothetical protein